MKSLKYISNLLKIEKKFKYIENILIILIKYNEYLL